MRLYFFTERPGMALSTQIAKARDQGYADGSPAWTDSVKTFPAQRERMLKALRPGHGDEIWVAHLAVLFANRNDLRHFVNALTEAGASIIEGETGWAYRPPYEEGLGFANLQDYWAKRRKLTDDPRGVGKATRNGSKKEKMPVADARVIWFDPSIPDNQAAVDKMNADPRYKGLWTYSCAAHKFKASGRPPGTRRRASLQTETNE